MDVIGNGQSAAFLYSDGALTNLRTLAGDVIAGSGPDSQGRGINNAGQVVGVSGTTSGTAHAFLYSNGTMIDLNTLLPASTGWELNTADDINDNGQIVESGL